MKALQLPNPAFFGGLSRASLLATTSLGHVIEVEVPSRALQPAAFS